MENNKQRYTITAALPYANGPVHIGHLAGCYLPADIYARYLRAAGEDVLYLCGSDEHGVAITLKARQEGITPQQVVDKYHNIMKDAFSEFGISFDIYSRTSSPLHHQTASDFFKVLHDKGVFVKKTSRQYYDVKYSQFLADRYIYGACPNCGYEKAYGDQCESCGKSLDPTDLIDPKSVLSGESPEMRETEHYYLPLQDYEPWLREWLLDKHKDWKNNVIGQCRSWLDQGLRERSITRDMEWGVKVPLPNSEGKVLYVWLDAPIGYITAAKEWGAQTGKDWEPYWKDENTKLVHFIGKDNIVFHCIIFPVMLKAHGEFILEDNVPANEFLNIEGQKVSTSRNWAVWLHEYLKDFPGRQDVLRYVLCANAPETKDNDFTWKDFQTRNNSELADILGNLLNRLVVLTHKYYDGHVPPRGTISAAEATLEQEVAAYPEKIGKLIRDFKFREAQTELMNLARLGNRYLTENEPWKLIKTDADRTATVMHFGLQLMADFSILAQPFIPFSAGKIRSGLGVHTTDWDAAGTTRLLKEGDMIQKIDILFPKIEDSTMEEQLNKLHSSQAANIAAAAEKPATDTTPQQEAPAQADVKPNINFDDFAKLDLRVATIIEAEKVPKADKLLKLTVDMGFEQRTVVSGIAEHYNAEDIIGKQVCVVANLEPRKLRGIMSQGMILMAEDATGKLTFVSPAVAIAAGSEVR